MALFINLKDTPFCILLVLLVRCKFAENVVYANLTGTIKDTTDRSVNEIKEYVPYSTEESGLSNPESTDLENHITTVGPKRQNQHSTEKKPAKTATTEPGKEYTSSLTQETTTEPQTAKDARTTTEKPTTSRPRETTGGSVDPMDQYLLDGILDIIDAKFDTLNRRLMTLERGVNNLQYYNVRSFRVVNTHLHAVDTTLHTIMEQVGQSEQQGRTIQHNVGEIEKEVTNLQSMNSDIFQAIEQNLVHFHQDLERKIGAVRENVEKSNVKIEQVEGNINQINTNVERLKQKQEDITHDVETSLALNSEVFQISLVISNSTKSLAKAANSLNSLTSQINTSITTVSGNVSALSSDIYDIKQSLQSTLTNISLSSEDQENSKTDVEDSATYQAMRSSGTQVKSTCETIVELLDIKFQELNDSLQQGQQRTCDCHARATYDDDFRNSSRKLLRALATVNENVFQSVTLYKHTGNLFERLIADTELIASEQVRLREELIGYLLNGTIDLFNQSNPEFIDTLLLAKTSRDHQEANSSQNCAMPKSLVDEIMKISYNGSQLLELLTDLATTTSSSIKLSIDKLDQQVSRLTEGQITSPLTHKFDGFVRDEPKSAGISYLKDIQNKTEWIYQLSEAIASNTGWIPYVFHNLRFVENQVNKTLKLVTSIDHTSKEVLIHQRANMAIMFQPKPATSEQTSHTAEESTESEEDEKKGTDKTSMFDQMVNYIYNINRKINRLIPALTYLLGEPEPYIALVDGKTDREGRVEVYHKGEWGTLAGDIGHIEASYICRKLGYLGGVSAGNGYFGSGSGQFWQLNVTCLRTRWCSAVSHVPYAKNFNHSQDVGVICDHMLRLTQTVDYEDDEVPRNSGKLEIYHQNTWFPVCSKGWGKQETNVACNQLGYREGTAVVVKDENLLDTHWMTGIVCKGNENRLDACVFEFEFNGCQDMKYISLVCS